jgi:hypothetical protein
MMQSVNRLVKLGSVVLLGLLGGGIIFLTSKSISADASSHDGEAQWVAGDELSSKQLDQLNIDVRLLFADRCYKCHNSTKHKAALILDTKEGIFEGGENGEVIVPGHSEDSELIRRVKLSSRNEDAMPPEGERLSKNEIELVSYWIDKGAHWADTTLKLFREAPLELTKPVLPSLDFKYRNPVDLWVTDYFQKNNIQWPELISDQRFIRKIYLDIIGQLPDPSTIEKFVANKDDNKYSLLIDDLLADDKNYTAHWLSFWNDLLRNDYTGTGYITNGRKQITDWLYCAIYDNIPYDQMVRELVDPREESEGFIAGIQWRGVVNASQRIELQAAQNISQSLLGINLKCASCHNSFVNNVTLSQAYAFANVFADTTLEIYQCDKPTGRFTSTDFIYPQLGPISGKSADERLTELSNMIVSPDNGRLYRTIVNRMWDRLFGRGLVGQVDNMDQLPWSQDLLDWLAADFIGQGFDLKKLLKTITSSKTYRLQPMEVTSPEVLYKNEFIFSGPVPRRISAEQFIDAFSDKVYPFYQGAHFSQNLPPGNPKWIWHREIEVDRDVLPKPGVRWFRKKFELKSPDKITEAEILVSADSAFTLFLNEQKIGIGNDWRAVLRTKIDPAILAKKNCLSVEAINGGLIANPAGILLSLKIKYPDDEMYIISDQNWISLDHQPDLDWHKVDFLDTAWSKVRSFGDKGYWGYPVAFNFEEHSDITARAALVALDPFSQALGRPSRENVTTKRGDEATLLQAMSLSNDELLADNISRGAKIWLNKEGDSNQKINDLFYELMSRKPVDSELQSLSSFLVEMPSQEAWEDIIWSILMLPEFHLI